MAQTPEERVAYLARLGKTEEYERNRKLMCWSNIPVDLAEEFYGTWEIEVQS